MTLLMTEPKENIVAENIDFETYLREFDGQHAEFYDGNVILMSPSTGEHNELVGFIFIIFNSYLGQTKAGKIRTEKVTMRMVIDGITHSPEPDIFVVKTENLSKLTKTYMDGAADLVVEVISADSEERDRGLKFTLYEKAGVKEYWMIDQIRKVAYFYVLNTEGRFDLRFPNEDGFYHSVVLPKLKIDIALFYKDEFPDANEIVEMVKKMLNMD